MTGQWQYLLGAGLLQAKLGYFRCLVPMDAMCPCPLQLLLQLSLLRACMAVPVCASIGSSLAISL